MFIQTEDTPNPNVMKFMPGLVLLETGSFEFKTEEEAERSPLAKRLFSLDFVNGVFIGTDFVSVTKSQETVWDVAKPLILGALMDHFMANLPIINTQPSQEADDKAEETTYSKEDQEIVTQIKDLLDTRIRPAVAVDGGDIVFSRYEKGIVYLKLKGACSGCPSSTVTLKNGIENMLRHYIPEVLEVCSEGESDAL